MILLYPAPASSIVTQAFAEHVARARANGWCPTPGNCPGGVYYYGGIDYAMPTGTPVQAAADGTVTVSRDDATGYGSHVRIQHAEGYLTVYGHLSSRLAQVGRQVRAGDVIGLSGNTGNSSGPHLHFEVRRNGTPVDPAPLLSAAGTPPEPTTEQPELVEFPKLPKARVIVTALSIRQAAGTSYPRAGYLARDTVVDVMRGVTDGDDIWLQIGYQQWIALAFKGDALAVWVQS